MTDNQHPRSEMFGALEAVKMWRKTRESDYDQQSRALQLQEKELESQLASLQAKLENIREETVRMTRDRNSLEGQHVVRTRNAVLNGLESAQSLLESRDESLEKMVSARNKRIKSLISSAEFSAKVDEYAQFHEMMDNMKNFPESYRNAMLSHHGQVRTELDPIFDAMNEPLLDQELSKAAISAVAFVDPPEGPPEALAILLPVSFEVYTNWAGGNETLKHKLLYRINAAISGMLKKIGVPDAPIMEENYDGFLLITVYLGNTDVAADVKNALITEIDDLRRRSAELASVQLTMDAIWLPPEVIAPDEGEADDEA